MMATTTDRRIYFASLADYNAGRLHGVWVDLDDCTDEDELGEKINAMLADSKEPSAEDWAIHDHEGVGNFLGEHSSISEIVTLANALEDCHEPDALLVYASDVGLEYAIQSFEEAYSGQWDSEEDFAHDLAESAGYLDAMPEGLRSYFDAAAFARDLFLGDYSRDEATGYVFRRM